MIVFNAPPFVGADPPEVMRKVLQEPVKFKFSTFCLYSDSHSNKFSQDCINFVRKLLEKDFNKRLSAKEALDDIWLKDQKVYRSLKPELDKNALNRIT